MTAVAVMAPERPVDPGKVAVYVRWSTDEQGEGHTLAIQLERCRHYLYAQGWSEHPELVYVDDGYSGGSICRPALGRLRAAVLAGRVECVVVYRLDRLSRNLVDTVDLVLKEWAGRCAVRSCSEEINTQSPAGRMFFNILVSFAEYERGLIRERTQAGKLKNAEAGRNPGITPPFGYRCGPARGAFAVDEAAAAVVRRVFEAYLAGRGARQIAAGLNSDGLPSPRGGRWFPQVVYYLLRNPAYTGVLRYGRIERIDVLPPIVAPDLFRRVQDLLHRRRQQLGRGHKPTYSDRYLLTGFARCRCGGALVPGRAGSLTYYRCGRALAAGIAACGCGSIPMAVLDGVVSSRVQAVLAAKAPPQVVARAAATLEGARRQAAAALARRRRMAATLRQRVEAATAGAEAARLRVGMAAEAGELARLARRCAVLREALRLLDGGLPGWDSGKVAVCWSALDTGARRRLVQALMAGVEAYRPRVRGCGPGAAAARGAAGESGGDGGCITVTISEVCAPPGSGETSQDANGLGMLP